ncbi:MAG: hypothetical protein QM811_23325 [Pirellulales bacterium]
MPGIETVISPDRQADEVVSHQPLVELRTGKEAELNWKSQTVPEADTLRRLTEQVEFRRPVWCLEFTFKPLRMITVDFPTANGKFQKKLVWYMVYRVRNNGGHLQPTADADGVWKATTADVLKTTVDGKEQPLPIKFAPHFSLETLDKKKAYLDRVIPVAVAAIQQREDPNRKLLNSVQIAKVPLEVATKDKDTGVWGVATWEDIDPAIDKFSVYVSGLTNAYRFIDPPGGFKPGSPPGTGRLYQTKALQLNFWRPGDEFNTSEVVIYYGVPTRGADGQETVIDHRWVFR